MSGSEHDFDFDDIRAWIEGRLDAERRARFEGDMARDPALARRVGEMQAVWSATAAGLGDAPSSTLTFDDVMGDASAHSYGETNDASPGVRTLEASRTRRRRVAAAALVFAVAATALGWAVWNRLGPGRRASVIVQLATIEMPSVGTSDGESHGAPDVDEPIETHARVPAVLADWSPVEDGRIRWLDSPADAAAISAATGRPVFVYGFVEDCPICRGFQAHEFRDADVLAWIDRTVPLAIDLMKLSEDEMNAIMARRYPLLELQDDHGRILRTFSGTFGEVDMPTEFANAVKDVTVPDWKAMRAAASDLRDAREAERREAWRDAMAVYEPLSYRDDLAAWSLDASDGIRRIARAAARGLESVRDVAERDPTAGMTALEIEIARFRGTRFESDLRLVLATWRDTGRFPRLRSGR